MVEIIAIAALVVVLAVIILEPLIARSRRRRRRADRKVRHQRIAREWGFVRAVLGPRRKRLTHRGTDTADD